MADTAMYEKMREIQQYLKDRYNDFEEKKTQQQAEGYTVGELINRSNAEVVAEIYNRIFNEEIA